MNRTKRYWIYSVAVATLLLLCSQAFAARKVIYVHGMEALYCYNGTSERCYYDGSENYVYWGNAARGTSRSSAFYVGYNGTSDPREWGSYVNGLRLSDGVYTGDGPYWNRAQSQIHAALWWGNNSVYGGASCNAGDTSCVLACHSAGCYALDYYFAHFDPQWEATNGSLNVHRIYASASATGGSEVANHRHYFDSVSGLASAFGIYNPSTWAGDVREWPMTLASTTSQARSFNHNATAGRTTMHFAGTDSGASGWFTDDFFGSRNDGVLGFHSACGYEPQIQTNNCSDAGGTCVSWSGCPWYWPLCTRYCRDFRKYNHWQNHSVPTDGQNYGVSGWSGSFFAYDKTHVQMQDVLDPILEHFGE